VDVAFDAESWNWDGAEPEPAEYNGRPCIRLESATATLAHIELVDGAIELELAASPERGFHGVAWRVRDDENFESFFVRPHQAGNDDAVQYTPVFNGISSWQLDHGPGFGDDTYRSRDYRFLGSIGYWDSLYLPLEAGENELVVAVSEDFGGWGVQARFPDASGLTL
jgi:hypothetical protein